MKSQLLNQFFLKNRLFRVFNEDWNQLTFHNLIIQLETKCKQLEIALQQSEEARQKDKMIQKEEIDRINKSFNLRRYFKNSLHQRLCIHPCFSFRGDDGMSKRIVELEESLKKANKELAKKQEIIQELKEKFFQWYSSFAIYI